jgi:hypothetical protein
LVPMSVIVDGHILVSELNNQFDKSGPTFKILKEIKISISLSNLSFNSRGQLLFRALNFILHFISINIFPLSS